MPDKFEDELIEDDSQDDSESGGGGEHDPYLDELESSMEDYVEEEPTRYEAPPQQMSEQPQTPKAPAESEFLEEPEAAPVEETAVGETLSPAELAADIPLEVRVVIGEKKMTLGEIIQLQKGELLDFEKGVDVVVDLMVEDKIIARGELVEIDGRLGVRIIRVLEE